MASFETGESAIDQDQVRKLGDDLIETIRELWDRAFDALINYGVNNNHAQIGGLVPASREA